MVSSQCRSVIVEECDSQSFMTPVPLPSFDIETIRVATERIYADLLLQHPLFAGIARAVSEDDPKEHRRRLMARSLRLTESMASAAYRVANDAKLILGITGDLELYQRSGPENAAMHRVAAPILLEIYGPLLSRLDERTQLGLFGHELGHYLAHGASSPLDPAHAVTTALGEINDDSLNFMLSRLSMAMELTADRIGLLTTQDLTAMLRLEMAAVTGLSSNELTWDTDAYLEQCRELIEAELNVGNSARGNSHPEHNLRAYALWLFSETKTYRELTGQGPGSRDLVDVDATIARCLSYDTLHESLALDYSRMGEPPQELHECALACAVIVAFADGELVDEEREEIERQFATLVPDWQTYLERDIALERFNETAPIIAGAGADLSRSLFFVLIRVLTADGEVHPDEISILLAIGRTLGVEAQFRIGLDAVCKTLQLQIEVNATSAPSVPLPARSHDVDEAFKTFLSNVIRRGEGMITLRRLLLLLGTTQRTDENIDRISCAFDENDIQVEPALATAGLDDRIRLTARVKQAQQATALPLDDTHAALGQAFRRLRDQLVSGDGRSPSVRLRQLRRGRAFDLALLDKVSVGMAQRVIEQIRARKTVRLVDAADAGCHGSAQTVSQDLLALAREDAQRVEETGARDLFAGLPFITGNVDGYTVRAPLILYPVTLERDGDGARGFKLVPRRDELPIANQSLIRLIFNKRGFAYSDELSDELEEIAGTSDGGPEAVLKKLGDVGLAAKEVTGVLQPFRNRDAELAVRNDGLEVEEVCVVGLFPQSSSDLLQDYDGLLQDLGQPSANIADLLGAASTLLPVQLGSRSVPPLAMPNDDWTPVIQADPSQRSVIAECRKHDAIVIDGPPGTGKSQVIVNLVAEALRRGERVAVVCEKRAALAVVQQRLAAIGFAKALGVVHDVYEDRKALFAHIAARVEARERIPFDTVEIERVRAEHAQTQRALEQRTAALRQTVPGLDMNVGELFAFVASQTSTETSSEIGLIIDLDHVPQTKLHELLDLVGRLHPLADLWGKASPWRISRRRSLTEISPTDRTEVERSIERTLVAARAYEGLLAKVDAPIGSIEAARDALITAANTRDHRTDDYDRAFFGPIANLAPDQRALTATAQATYRQASTALTRFNQQVELEPGGELIAAISVLRRWSSSWLRVLVFGWWKARGVFRREITRLLPEHAGDAITPALLDEISDRITASRAWKSIGDAFNTIGLSRLLPATAAQLASTIERIASLSAALASLGKARPALEQIGAWIPSNAESADSANWDRAIDERLAVLAAKDALTTASAAIAPWSPFPIDALPPSSQLQRFLDLWRRDATRLTEADSLIARLTAMIPNATAFLDMLSDRLSETTATAWRKATTTLWGQAWVARLEREQPMLAHLGHADDDREVDRLVGRLRELETECRELEIERTLARIDDARLLNVDPAARGARRTPDQKIREDLLKEVSKQRQLMPLRTFVRKFAPQGLLDVVPVWLLSPETMAILFPRQALFDLVVFDEASQCTVESGLPVLMRAKRVAIAGDEKQMPPSSYFTLGTDEDDELPSDNETNPDGTKEMVKDLLSAESLLSLARPRVSHTGLNWHYRCRDESLIAFSNHAMYQGELLTIPSTLGGAAPSAIQWVPVENATYVSGENPIEAARVVDVIDELLARTKPPTIGVVTFNLKQRRAILDAIDKRSNTDQTFQERWLAATTQGRLDERPFVKNLEQVQGDERDIIIFSLGHAPIERKRNGVATGDVYVPARFGPLGQRGGERRLNVAISRAKAACYVVASFDPAQLTVATSKNSGPRLFKEFLEFAHLHHHGRKLDAQRVLDRVRERGTRLVGQVGHRMRLPIDGFVPVQTQIALELEAAGIPYELDVGASEFRVPIAVLDPADPTRYALAVLIDDAQASADPFEHHVHRPGVLCQRDWNVLHVTSLNWLRRKSEIIAKIEVLVPDCRRANDNEIYMRHREQQQKAFAPIGTVAAAFAKRIVVAPNQVEFPATPHIASTVAQNSDVPAWALEIIDDLFRKALLHIEKHGFIDEADLTSLVGGPRRARVFASELDTWNTTLPFSVEVSIASGIKSYRKQGKEKHP